MGQLVFGKDMILHINHVEGWRYICQRKQTQINKDITRENTTRIYHNYRVGDKVMTNNSSAYKYKTPLRGPYENVSNVKKRYRHLTNRSGYT